MILDMFRFKLFVSLTFMSMFFVFFTIPTYVSADSNDIEILSHSVTSQFPDGLKFAVTAKSTTQIVEVAVRFKVGHQKSGVYEYFEFVPSEDVEASLFWNTNTRAKYIPPGTNINYSFVATNIDGESFETEKGDFTYADVRYEWDEVSEGGITVYYHGPVKARAQAILDSILQTMIYTEPVFGEQQKDSIRVSMYNNVKEMLYALPPNSSTIRKELITEGQAFPSIGTLLVLGGGRLSVGTASHEVAHILIHRAGDSVYGNVPAWLDEGLAELANVSPSFSYDIALDFAVHSGRLLPITSMPRLPGNPEDVIIFYGQAKSVVEFMVIRYGVGDMRTLMSTMKTGVSVDDAIKEVYGVSRVELENLWRDYIGAPPYLPPPDDYELPTPVPMKAVTLYTLTPQAGGSVIESNLSKDSEMPSMETSIAKAKTVGETGSNSETVSSDKAEQKPINAEASTSAGSCNRGGKLEYVDLSDMGLVLFLFLFSSRRSVLVRDI